VDEARDARETADQIEELFSDLWQVFPFARGMRRGFRPNVDCFRTDDPPTFVVLIELPGVDPEQVHIEAGPSALTIWGDRRRTKQCGHYQHMEIDYGPFRRRVVLPEDVDPDRASASYGDGMLRVTLPISPRPEPRERVSIEVRMGR
jgi:HSP20 family protein